MTNLDFLTHTQLEMLAEEAEDYLIELNIPLSSHSYVNIIQLAQKHGFNVTASFSK